MRVMLPASLNLSIMSLLLPPFPDTLLSTLLPLSDMLLPVDEWESFAQTRVRDLIRDYRLSS